MATARLDNASMLSNFLMNVVGVALFVAEESAESS